jgi:hypothetical protein
MSAQYDYHFLILGPGLSAAWFTQAARQYWLRLQPIVCSRWEMLSNVPAEASVAVTLLARPDAVSLISRQIAAIRPDLHLDVIAADDLPSVEALLNERADKQQPFG